MRQLRVQMDNAMLVRGLAERTRETYLAAITRLARAAISGSGVRVAS